MKKLILLLGPPGSGKGTQGRIIAKHYNFHFLSIGEALRRTIEEKTDLARKIQDTLSQGKLVESRVILQLFSETWEASTQKGIVCDGFPRNEDQAILLEQWSDLHRECTLGAVCYLSVSDEILIERLSLRYVCQSCGAVYARGRYEAKDNRCEDCGGSDFVRREDDKEDVVKMRLTRHRQDEKVLVDKYKKMCRLHVFRANQPKESLSKEILDTLAKVL